MDPNTNSLRSIFTLLIICLSLLETYSQPDNIQDPPNQIEQTPTTRKKLEQWDIGRKIRNTLNVSLSSHFKFELPPKIMTEFYLHLPSDMDIALQTSVYVHDQKSNLYTYIQDIDQQPPVQVTVFQNNNRVAAQGMFYFKGVTLLKGQKDATYHIRFYTTGTSSKLIVVDHNPIFQSWDFNKYLREHHAVDYLLKSRSISNQLEISLKQLMTNRVLTVQDQRQIRSRFQQYTAYQLTEAVLVLTVCFIQVKVIGGLLKPGPII